MTLDLARLRQDTPGCAYVTHLNNAGAALLPAPVLQTVKEHLDLEARLGGYEAAERAGERLEAVYTSVADLVGADAREIALVGSATQAWHRVFHALPFEHGDRIVTTPASYASNFISFLHKRKTHGVAIRVVPETEEGALDLDVLERELARGARLVALTHVPTNNGLVNPAEAVGRLARRYEVPYLLDACQSVGQLELDVRAIGCDFLSATGRKYLRAPRGTGFLFVRDAWIDRLHPPAVDLHGARWTSEDTYRLREDARRFEDWERSVAGQLGLGAAARYALDAGLPAIEARVTRLAEELRVLLGTVPAVRLHDRGTRRCGIVTFSVENAPAETVKARCRAAGVNVSVSTPSSTLLDARARGLPDLVRASVHYYNTAEELHELAGVLRSTR